MSRKRTNTSKRPRGMSKRKLQQDVEFLNDVVYNNGRAMADGPKKKNWSRHDIKTNIKPMTVKQTDMFHAYFNGLQLAVYGSAGTGKTFLALYLALLDVLERRDHRNKIIIVRSAVPTREQGFLKGTLEEKQMHYETPYRDILAEFFHVFSTYDNMKEAGLIEFMTTSFVRGLTWDNSIIIIDESQNLSWHEINSILTRVGQNTRVILTGDLVQTDLARHHERSGMEKFLTVAEKMSDFGLIEFTKEDIVRSGFVRRWIEACEDLKIT